jgi:hypothetical protein
MFDLKPLYKSGGEMQAFCRIYRYDGIKRADFRPPPPLYDGGF